MERSRKAPTDFVEHLGFLSHDLSNSLETILQAAYLLQEAKLDGIHKKWAQMTVPHATQSTPTVRSGKYWQNGRPSSVFSRQPHLTSKTDN